MSKLFYNQCWQEVQTALYECFYSGRPFSYIKDKKEYNRGF